MDERAFRSSRVPNHMGKCGSGERITDRGGFEVTFWVRRYPLNLFQGKFVVDIYKQSQHLSLSEMIKNFPRKVLCFILHRIFKYIVLY